ncbi:hypothetical protein V6N13_083648 [Hibiscus sabdariffa]|uniref:Uncharacterized protein n=1 Tax=Hibiscus sabdariffa TaxID=183260 RepID=A0ABR2SYN9_9ROSI
MTRNQTAQSDIAHLQSEISRVEGSIDSKLQELKVSVDASMDTKMQELKVSMMGDLQKIIKRALGKTSTPVEEVAASHGMPGFQQAPEATRNTPIAVDSGVPTASMRSQSHTGNGAYRLMCPEFDGSNFRSWLSKLEQFFEAEGISEE